MKIYFLVPDGKDTVPTASQLDSIKEHAEIEIIPHKGKLAEIAKLKEDSSEKILAVDPDTFEWDLDAETLKEIPNVKGVCTSSTSFDWIKPTELKGMGILGINVPGFSSDSVAEYAVCMAIETARQLPMVIKNGWIPTPMDKPFLLKGKKAGVIGLGRIGKRMAEILQGIGMEVLYWSRSSTDARFKKVELDELFRQADLIMPALVENKETKQIITNARIDLMKPTSIFVGINRVKAIFDEDYLIQKVERGEIGGYAFEGDNRKSLEEYKDNIWALPPIAWATHDSLENLMQIWVDNIIALAKGQPQNVVNK